VVDDELAKQKIELMGLDHSVMVQLLNRWRSEKPEAVGACAKVSGLRHRGILTVWLVQTFGNGTEVSTHLVPIAVDELGQRIPTVEKQYRDYFGQSERASGFDARERNQLMIDSVEPALQRELNHRGLATATGGYATELLVWIEMTENGMLTFPSNTEPD